MNIAQLLNRTAVRTPLNPALAMGSRDLTDYAGFARKAFAMATAFRDHLGLQRGDRIALYMANTPEYLELLYATWAAGMVVVPLNYKLHPKEAMYILEDSGARALFSDRNLLNSIHPLLADNKRLQVCTAIEDADYLKLSRFEASAPVQIAADELAWLFYTSGTTGRPKGVMLTHRNLMTMTLCYFTDVDSVQARDTIIYAAPISHGAGMYNFAHVLAGARHLVPESRGFEAEEVFSLASQYDRLSGFVAPTMLTRMVDYAEARGISSDGIKTLVYGGGPMYVSDIERALVVMGQRFVQIYGQGECPMAITALSRNDLQNREHANYTARLASVGSAQSASQIRIVDGNGAIVPEGTAGEIVVYGDAVMKGYWNNEPATAKALRDGWLYTGDIGVLDAYGYLTLKDRSKDVIISGGSNIYPREVEEALLRHPAVQEVTVVGRLHQQWGEEVVAAVVLRQGMQATTEELDQVCLNEIARFKRPKAYRLVQALPKNNYGKVLKTEVRQWFLPKDSSPSGDSR